MRSRPETRINLWMAKIAEVLVPSQSSLAHITDIASHGAEQYSCAPNSFSALHSTPDGDAGAAKFVVPGHDNLQRAFRH